MHRRNTTFKLPSSFLSKKCDPFSDASSIRSSFLEVMKIGNWLSAMSWILWGRGCSSWDTKCLTFSQALLISLKIFCTSLHSTMFLVMKTWWRWSHVWSSSPSTFFPVFSVRAAPSSGVSSSKSPILSTIDWKKNLNKMTEAFSN